MNKAFRVVWSQARQGWAVASEHARGDAPVRAQSLAIGIAPLLLVASQAGFAQVASTALPTGGTVAAGNASIVQSGNRLTVNQTTDRAIVNWQTFNIGGQASVVINQPGAASASLNRVLSAEPSTILGTLSSNGQVVLVNPAGVVVGAGGRIDAAGVIASTLGIADADFLGGRWTFSRAPGAAVGAIRNDGTITAQPGGYVAFLGPRIENTGTVEAPQGAVLAGAGDRVTLARDPEGVLQLSVDAGTVDALVKNAGIVRAPDGRVIVTARAAGELARSAINMSGIVDAGSLRAEGGRIVLDAGASGTTEITGTVSATGATRGGEIRLLGERVGLLPGTRVDASGDTGGGTVLVGGNYLGRGPEANALATVVAAGASVAADARVAGDGGRVIVWSDDFTRFDGTISANGGAAGGNGGFVETSSRNNLQAFGSVSTRAPAGQAGTWLLDPRNVNIVATDAVTTDYTVSSGTYAPASNDATIAASVIANALASGNVTVTTSGGGTQAGDITVSSAITKAGGGATTLTLQADRNIIVNANITSTSGALGLTLSAGNGAGATTGGVNINANIDTNGGNLLVGGVAGTTTNGIGFARNIDASNAAIVIQQNRSVLTNGGRLVMNGLSTVGSNSGNYSGDTGGVYVRSGATVLSGTGDLYITGESSGGIKTFGFAVEANAGTLTVLGSAASGGNAVINAVNSTASGTTQQKIDGALGLVNNGSIGRLSLRGASVANQIIQVNGQTKLVTYTMGTGCSPTFPNCGTLAVPGANSSYLYAGYDVVAMGTKPIYVQTGSGSKTYDGTTLASGLTLTTTGAPADFSTSGLNFYTSSRNAGTYTSLSSGSNPTSFASIDGNTYAIGYYSGSYTINQRPVTAVAGNKVYDGTTSASITATNFVSGDAVGFSYTAGAFANANVGTWSVTASGITLTGADAGNYSFGGGSLTSSASITARPVNLTGTRVYDGTTGLSASVFTLGNLASGESLTLSGSGSVADRNVGTGKTVTIGTLALGDGIGGGSLASNYTLSGGTHTADITRANLTVSGLAAQNKTYDGTTAATLTGTASLAGVIGGDVVSVGAGSAGGTFADRNVGTGKTVTANLGSLTLSGADAGNYQISGVTSPLSADITKATLTVSGLTAQNKAYDGTTAATLTGTAALAGVIGSDTVAIGGTATSGTFADKNAGTGKTVTANLGGLSLSGTDASNYQIGSVTSPLMANIDKATLTVSGLTAQNKTYDGTTAATLTGTAALAGVIGSDTVAIGGTATSGTFADKNAGTGKTVTANLGGLSLSGADANNYQIGSVTSPLTANIDKATLTVSGLTAQNKTYDGTTAATLTGTAALAGVIGSDTVAIGGTATSGTFADKNAGTGKTVTADLGGLSLGGTDANNYQIGSVTSPLTANIDKATLTVSGLTAQNKTYDGTTAATLTGTAALAGVLGGDVVNVGGTANSGTFANKNAGTGKTVTANLGGLSLSGADANNYQIGSVTSPLTANIDKATVTVSGLTAQNKTYDGTTAATLTGTAAVAGVIGSDTVTVGGTATSGTFANKNAGTGKTVTANLGGLSLSGADANNYQIGSVTSPLTADIAKATLTVSGLTAQNKTYDGTTAATLTGTAALAGVIGGDTVSVSGTANSGTFADKNAGTGKTVTANLGGLTLSGADANNYQIGSVTSPLTANIDKATLTVSGLTAQNKTYDGTTAATLTGTAALAGVIGSDTVAIGGTATSGAFADKSAGTGKTVTANLGGLSLSGADANNYQIGSVTSPLTANIDKATLTVSGLTAQNKTYDGTTAATLTGTAALAGVIGGDTVSVSGTANSGTFANKNAGTGKTVTANLGGLTLGGTDANNYQIGSATSPLTANIDKATLTVSGLTAQNKTYDGTTAATLTGTAALAGVIGGDTVSVSGTANSGTFANKNAGTGKTVTANLGGLTLGGTDANNYQIGSVTSPLTANIDTATLTVSGLTAQNKTYDGTTAATLTGTAALAGVIGSDAVSVSGTANSGTFADRNAGTGKTVTANLGGLSLSGTDANNYQIGSVTSPLAANIDKATLTISGLTAQNKTYDGTTAATLTGTAALAGVIGSDTVAIGGTATSGTFADKNAGTGKTVTANLGGLSLSGADASNYQIGSVTSPLAADIAKATLTVSGLTAQDKTFDGTTAATLTGTPTLAGVIGADTVATAGTATSGSFADATAGTAKPVTPTLGGLSLTGADAGNYVIAGVTSALTATITPAASPAPTPAPAPAPTPAIT
jgi:filamentous hemagglutinin family protein